MPKVCTASTAQMSVPCGYILRSSLQTFSPLSGEHGFFHHPTLACQLQASLSRGDQFHAAIPSLDHSKDLPIWRHADRMALLQEFHGPQTTSGLAVIVLIIENTRHTRGCEYTLLGLKRECGQHAIRHGEVTSPLRDSVTCIFFGTGKRYVRPSSPHKLYFCSAEVHVMHYIFTKWQVKCLDQASRGFADSRVR